jgi:prepilin-type N-terminal cleavage/methylation domain-containing protein
VDKKRAFTLLELIVVIIIVGVLGSLGFTRYSKAIEKSRIAEAKTLLGGIRKAEEGYKQEYGTYTNDLASLNVEVPTACVATHYFSYSSSAGVGCATRCSSGGKFPNYTSGTLAVNITYETGAITEEWGSGGGDGGGYPCFLPGSRIQLTDGSTKPIEQIKPGDLVLAYVAKKIRPSRVIRVFYHPNTKGYLVIKAEDGRELKVTPNHPLFNGKAFEEAGNLKAGDYLYALEGNKLRALRIISLERKDISTDVYNIEVDKYHSYFSEGILAHNKPFE